MSDVMAINYAWLAGVYEGEGSIWFADRDNAIRIAIEMTDQDVVEKVRAVAACGSITSRRRPGRKEIWSWHVSRREDIERLSSLILPHLGERRRRQMQGALARYRVRRSDRPACKNGHPWKPETTRVETRTGARGGTFRRCLVCERDRWTQKKKVAA